MILLVLAIPLSGVAGAAVVLAVGRVRGQRIVDAPHVRLGVAGAGTNEFTVDGFQLRQYRDRTGERWLVLRDVTVLKENHQPDHAEGEMHIPVARIMVRQSISDVLVGPLEVRA